MKIIYLIDITAASRSSNVDSNSEQASRPGRREVKFMDCIDFCRFVSSFGFNWGTSSGGQPIKRQVRVHWVSVFNLYSSFSSGSCSQAESSIIHPLSHELRWLESRNSPQSRQGCQGCGTSSSCSCSGNKQERKGKTCWRVAQTGMYIVFAA